MSPPEGVPCQRHALQHLRRDSSGRVLLTREQTRSVRWNAGAGLPAFEREENPEAHVHLEAAVFSASAAAAASYIRSIFSPGSAAALNMGRLAAKTLYRAAGGSGSPVSAERNSNDARRYHCLCARCVDGLASGLIILVRCCRRKVSHIATWPGALSPPSLTATIERGFFER